MLFAILTDDTNILAEERLNSSYKHRLVYSDVNNTENVFDRYGLYFMRLDKVYAINTRLCILFEKITDDNILVLEIYKNGVTTTIIVQAITDYNYGVTFIKQFLTYDTKEDVTESIYEMLQDGCIITLLAK